MKFRDYFKADNFIISAQSRWKTSFDIIMLFTVTYSIFYSLLFVSFEPEISEEVEIINHFITSIFILDFIFSKFKIYQLIFKFLCRFFRWIWRLRNILIRKRSQENCQKILIFHTDSGLPSLIPFWFSSVLWR